LEQTSWFYRKTKNSEFSVSCIIGTGFDLSQGPANKNNFCFLEKAINSCKSALGYQAITFFIFLISFA